MTTHLNSSHQATYNAVFQHPVARNLYWRDLRSLLNALAVVKEGESGMLKITRNGHNLIVQRPRKNIAQVQELMDIRRFLEESAAVQVEPMAKPIQLLVVIDHREARIYKTELHGSVPHRITPYDPHGTGRHLHRVENDSNGQRKPEIKSFYEAVAKTLRDTGDILMFGHGTGASSAMNQLLAALEHDHIDIHQRIVGTIVLDDQHLSDNQILARAREFYKGLALY
jgi:hypothetical protein